MGRRDAMESLTNAAFGIVTGSVVMTTPISNYAIASAATEAIPKNDAAAILMDGTTAGWMMTPNESAMSSSPTTLYMAQQTPKQLISSAKNVIQTTCITYIDNNNWSAVTSSYNTQNPLIRNNANIIVSQNPGIPALATRRTTMFNQLDTTKAAIDAHDKVLASSRTITLITRIGEFLAIAP